jgi:low affinity Fe/Cu permease
MTTETRTLRNWFDRFARRVEDLVSTPWFFATCVLIVLVWAPLFFALPDIDTWQLIINTTTTIITFLLVALMQNASRQAEREVHDKLDQILKSQRATEAFVHTLLIGVRNKAGGGPSGEEGNRPLQHMRDRTEGPRRRDDDA